MRLVFHISFVYFIILLETKAQSVKDFDAGFNGLQKYISFKFKKIAMDMNLQKWKNKVKLIMQSLSQTFSV